MHLLIVDSFPADFIAQVNALPLSVDYRPKAQRPEILTQLPEADLLLINSKIQLDREAIDQAKKLRLVIRAGVGMDHFDLGYLAEKGIRAVNCQGANAEAVGEQAVGMLLSLRHHLRRADQEVRRFEWRREANRGRELTRETVGLIGYGHTGQAVAKRLSGFGCQVLAYDKYRHSYGDTYAREASLEEIFAEAGVLSLHVPLTEETHHWVDGDFLGRFARPIHLLNLARGPVLVLEDLLQALDEGQVLGAALDVLENEKLDRLSPAERQRYERLFAREDVLLSPHIGGWTVESRDNIGRMVLSYLEEAMSD
jgi:D-3-phosphoglycerate dehydrogenase / 2-oxoglutarate reductase